MECIIDITYIKKHLFQTLYTFNAHKYTNYFKRIDLLQTYNNYFKRMQLL